MNSSIKFTFSEEAVNYCWNCGYSCNCFKVVLWMRGIEPPDVNDPTYELFNTLLLDWLKKNERRGEG